MKGAPTGTNPRLLMNSNSNKYSGVLIRLENSVLLCKRQPHGPLGGYWSVPAGMVEEGESPRQGAHRELKEETQIDVDIERLQHLTAFEAYDGGSFDLYLYETSDWLSPQLDYEHTAWGYFALTHIESLHIGPHLQEAIIKWRDIILDCE